MNIIDIRSPETVFLNDIEAIADKMKTDQQQSKELADHLFKIEYGKIVSVITKYLGVDNLKLAEDIAQEAFYKAVKYWQHNGIPPNPKAWLYTTAKNECSNIFKKNKHRTKFENQTKSAKPEMKIESLDFTTKIISDELLRMMFVCCHPSISQESQLALILKILCGFSISEIASAFFTSTETINKRLVRARKKMREVKLSFELVNNIKNEIPTVLNAIYLLFNEGYLPSEKSSIIRKELCFEAIRLAELLNDHSLISNKDQCQALLSLMYLNASRFDARTNDANEVIDMKNQDRLLWNKILINHGLSYLDKALESKSISIYHILAAISANHCTAPNFESTNWDEILGLYDSLLQISDTTIIRLNRSVALSKVEGNDAGIKELEQLKQESDLKDHHLFHSTLAQFYLEKTDFSKAEKHFKTAIRVANNERDKVFLKRKLEQIVPI